MIFYCSKTIKCKKIRFSASSMENFYRKLIKNYFGEAFFYKNLKKIHIKHAN